jgi:hypothetical protein
MHVILEPVLTGRIFSWEAIFPAWWQPCRVGRKFSTGIAIFSGSSKSYRAIAANARAMSLTERASGPMVSKSTVSPSALAFDTRSNVGRRPTTQSTQKNDENAPAQAHSPVPLISQRLHQSFKSCWRGSASSTNSHRTSLGAQSEARKQGSGWRDRRNEAISEVTLAVATIAMLAAIAAAVRS